MASTPLWVPIAVAGLGLLATIAGVLITQRRSDERDKQRWNRDRERERDRWAREDAARTFEHRREAYSQFYESLREMAFTAYNHGLGLAEKKELDSDWQLSTYRKLQHLQLYGSRLVYDGANGAYTAAWRWGQNTAFGKDDDAFYELQDRYDEAEDALRKSIRQDLSIGDE